MKVFQIDDFLVSVFPMEATLTSRLCHSNLAWLYGITEHGPRKMLVLSFHGIDDKSCTLHKALNYDSEQLWFDRSLIDWKVIIIDLLSAVNYLRKNRILHNDIKSDNIVIDKRSSTYRCVLIDLGKGCDFNNAKSINYLKLKDVGIPQLPQIFEMAIASSLSIVMCMLPEE